MDLSTIMHSFDLATGTLFVGFLLLRRRKLLLSRMDDHRGL